MQLKKACGALNVVAHLNDQVLGTVRDVVPPGRAEFERPLHHLSAHSQLTRLVPKRLEAAQPGGKNIDFRSQPLWGAHISKRVCVFHFCWATQRKVLTRESQYAY